jgi:biopolymer transport protein ExbD
MHPDIKHGMAEVTNKESGSKRSLTKPRSTKHPLRVDLTPMVDLAFLLIAFFMLTSVVHKPKKLDLDKRIVGPSEPIGDCQVLNLLVDSLDNIYTYEGLDMKKMKQTSLDAEKGVRHIILDKAKAVSNECGVNAKGEKRQLFCLIKLFPGSHYQSMVSVLDEVTMALKPGQYSLQEPLLEEVKELERQKLLAEK